MKKMPALILTSIALVFASTAFADEEPIADEMLIAEAHEAHGDGPALPKFTDEQLDKIHAIRTKYADAEAARMAESDRLHRKLFDQLSLANVDKNEVLSLQSKINEIEGQTATERVQMRIELHDVLSFEQRQQIRRHMLAHDLGGPGIGPDCLPGEHGMPPGGLGMPPGGPGLGRHPVFGFGVPVFPPPH